MPESLNELEKLREILYGEQMRQIQARLHALEISLQNLQEQIFGQINTLASENKQTLAKQSKELRQMVSSQSQSLVQQIEALRQQIAEESQNSQKRDVALKEELRQWLAALETGKVSRAELGQALVALGEALEHGK